MNTNSLLATKFVRKRVMSGVFNIVLIIGGAKAILAKLKALYPASLFVVIDNRREVQLLSEQFPSLDITYFAMGDSETTASLHKDSRNDVFDASQRTTNTIILNGYGARLENAAKAADQLIDSPAFKRFLSSLVDEGLVRTKGRLHMANILTYGSSCGAGNAGSSLKIVDQTAQQLACLQAPIQIQFDTLGSITFTGAANRGRQNSAQFLLRLVAYSLRFSKIHELKAAKTVQLQEYVPTGIDQESRYQLVQLDAVAMNSVQMQEYLSQPQPNREQDDQFGAILSRNIDFCKPLDRIVDIANVAAASYYELIESSAKHLSRDTSTIEDLVFDESDHQELRRESIDRIMQGILEATDESEVLRAILRPERTVRLTVRATSSIVSDCVLERLSVTLANTPANFDEFVRRIELFMGYEAVLSNQLFEIEDAIEHESSQLKQMLTGFETKLKKARYKGRILSDKWSLQLANELRQVSDVLHLLKEKRSATIRARSVVIVELGALQDRLTSIKEILSSYIPRNSQSQTAPLVTFSPLNSAFAKLLALASLNETQRTDLLCSTAVQCTESGLAKIVSADSDRLDEIARKIVFGEYPVIGPSHGAQYRSEPAGVVYALPPLEPQLETTLSDLIKELAPGRSIVFGDTVAFGACVQRYSFRRFHSVQEIFDGMMGHDLWLSLTDERAALNSKDGWQIVQALGGRTEGESIVFDGAIDYDAIAKLDL